MKIEVNKKENNQVELDIEIDAKTAQEEYNKACRNISKNVDIPGFRKGKAPQKMVESRVGVDYIKNIAMEAVLPNIFRDVIDKNKFEIITEPVVEKYDFTPGKAMKIKATLELKPEVKLGQYKDLSIEFEEFKNEDNALDIELETIADKFATQENIEGRASLATDIVNIDFEGTVDGELIQGGSAKGYKLDLAHSNFIDGFAEQLVGKNIGEEFDINVTFPKDYHDEKLKGKPAIFKIKMNAILEKKVPEINDELAKKMGNFDSLDKLKEDIVKFLDNNAKTENEKRYAQKLFDAIVEAAEVDIQETMIDRETNQLVEEFKSTLQARGGNYDEVVKAQGLDKMMASFKEEAQKRIKNSLVIQEIQKNENIAVTPQDIQRKFQDIAQMYRTDVKTVIEQLKDNQAMLYSISQQAATENVMKFLVDNNKPVAVSKSKTKPKTKAKAKTKETKETANS